MTEVTLTDKIAMEDNPREPFLPADLIDADAEPENKSERSVKWHVRALFSLSKQLGAGNDFYFPLIGAAGLLGTLDSGCKRVLQEMESARAEAMVAHRAGAEQMRERAAQVARLHPDVAHHIRALPVE